MTDNTEEFYFKAVQFLDFLMSFTFSLKSAVNLVYSLMISALFVLYISLDCYHRYIEWSPDNTVAYYYATVSHLCSFTFTLFSAVEYNLKNKNKNQLLQGIGFLKMYMEKLAMTTYRSRSIQIWKLETFSFLLSMRMPFVQQ